MMTMTLSNKKNNDRLTLALATWGGITATTLLIRWYKRHSIRAREERVASQGGLMPQVKNAVEALAWRGKHSPTDRIALEAADGKTQYTWQQYYDQVQQFAKSLLAIQAKIPNDAQSEQWGVAVHAFNEPRWFFAALGALAAEWTVSGIYLTNTYPQAAHVMKTSHVKVLVLESEELLQTTYAKVLSDFPDLTVVLLQGDGSSSGGKDRVLSYSDFLAKGNGFGSKDPKDLNPETVTSLVRIFDSAQQRSCTSYSWIRRCF